VAEDDAEMRRILVEMLEKDGYDVNEVANGEELLDELAKDAVSGYEYIDLIVSDIRMPGCTGLQAVEAVRGAGCQTPILLMTAFGDEATRAHAEELGALLFDKPFDLTDLRTAVVSLLGRSIAG
jgi:DNA-binding response OmpR family regulator